MSCLAVVKRAFLLAYSVYALKRLSSIFYEIILNHVKEIVKYLFINIFMGYKIEFMFTYKETAGPLK